MLPDVVKWMFAAVIKVKNLKMRGLSWIYRMGPISSHESVKWECILLQKTGRWQHEKDLVLKMEAGATSQGMQVPDLHLVPRRYLMAEETQAQLTQSSQHPV